MAAKQLREYQSEAEANVFKRLAAGINKQVVVLPTGGGKTLLASRIATKFKRILFMSHTEELISQSGAALLDEFYPEISIREIINQHGDIIEYFKYLQKNTLFASPEELNRFGIIKADMFKIDSHITLASFQTIHRRLDKIPKDWFDLIIVDECDLAMALTVTKTLQYLTSELLLGLTATPTRTDGASLASNFDEIVYQYSLADAIKDGYLCELDCIQLKTQLNLDNVRTTAGEFNQKDLKEAVDTDIRNQMLVDKYKQYAEGKANIVFCVDVEHAQNVCQKFKNAGYKAEFIVGDKELTPDRVAIINRFKSGETQILTNCMILTAGFDHPGVGCITLASPTKSTRKFLQQIGRGTRTLPGVIDKCISAEDRRLAIKESAKPNCIVLDVVDTTSKHKIINSWTLDRDLPAEKKVFITSEKRQTLIDFREKRKFDASKKVDTRVNLFELPVVKHSDSMKMKEPATVAQLGWLQKLGHDIMTMGYTKLDATRLISVSPASNAQINLLRYKGYDVSKGVTIGEFQLAMEQITKRENEAKAKAEIKSASKGMLPIDGLN